MDLKNYLLMFRVKIALKITLGGLIAVLICNFFHLPSGFLSPVILLMVMSGFHGKIFEVGVQTLIGCVLSGIYSLFIVYYLLDSKPLYLLLSAVWIFFCITFIGKYFIASILSAILTTMTLFVAVFGTVSETTASVHNFIVQLFIALTVSWFVDELLIPHRSEGLLYLTISTVYKDYSIRFKSYIGAEGQGTRPQKFGSASIDIFNNLVNLVRRTEREARGEEFHAEPFLKLVAYAKSLYIKIDVLAGIMSEEHSCLEDKLVSDSLNDIFSSLAAGFEELADAIDENRASESSGSELDAKITNLKDLNAKMRLADGKDQDYFEDLLSLGSILPLLEDTAALLGKAFNVWDIIYTRAYDKLVLERVTRSPSVESAKSFGIPYLTKDAVHQSLKTVIVIVLLLFGEFLFNLPGGYQASFYGVLFGSIPNTGQAHLRGKLGIIGVAAGLIYGIVGLYIVTLSPHFPVLLLIYTLGTIVTAYIASGGQKMAFSGLQAGLMLPYVFFTSMGPGINLHLALMRFFALLMASSIGLLVLYNIWPVSPYRKLKKKISSALRISGAIFDKLLILDEKEKIMAKDKIEALVNPLASAMPTSSSLLFDAQYIISDEKLHSEEFVQIIESLEVIYAELETLKKTMYAESDNELIIKYFEHMTPVYRTIYDYFGKTSQQFYTGDAVAPLIIELSRRIQDHRQVFRETGFWKRFPMEEVEKAVLVAESVDAVLESLYKISVSIAVINQSEAPSPAELRTSSA